MHRLNYEVNGDEVKLPRDVFNMVGGTGSGGLGDRQSGATERQADTAADISPFCLS